MLAGWGILRGHTRAAAGSGPNSSRTRSSSQLNSHEDLRRFSLAVEEYSQRWQQAGVSLLPDGRAIAEVHSPAAHACLTLPESGRDAPRAFEATGTSCDVAFAASGSDADDGTVLRVLQCPRLPHSGA